MKQLIEDYKRRLKTINESIVDFKSDNTGSINDIRKLERLTTKASEYRTFIADLERLNVQPDTKEVKIPTGILNKNDIMIFEDATPDIGETIGTVGALKAFLNTLKNDDLVVMETIDLETGDVQDLYPFHMDVIDGIELTDGRTVSEIRFCQESNIPEELKALYAKHNVQPDETPQLIRKIDFTTLRTQKKTLIEIIDEYERLLNVQYQKGINDDKISDLSGILNLIDCLQDYAVDVMGLNPIDVFDFELEESREDMIKPEDVTKLTYPTDDVVNDIIDRKRQGIDCTEEESAEIKGFLRELKLPDEQAIVTTIQSLFPIEYGEFLDEV